MIFVDDGSTDGTLAALKALNAQDRRLKAISLSRNFGKEIAIAAGLSYATGDAAVLMDADLQHPPELIRDFVERWRAGFDIVYGQRIDRDTDSFLHRWAARAFYVAFQKLSGTTLPEGAGDFRLLDRKAIDAMNRMRERVRFNKGLFAWMGFRSIGVPFHVPPRQAAAARAGGRAQLLRFALDGIASFTTIPLRVWSYLGLMISLFAFVLRDGLPGQDAAVRHRRAGLPDADHLGDVLRRRAAASRSASSASTWDACTRR